MTGLPGDLPAQPSPDTDSRPVVVAPEQILAGLASARACSGSEAVRAHGTPVKVLGTAVPGPLGSLRAPLSGRECVWYRSVVLRQLRATLLTPTRPFLPIPSIAASDLPGYGGEGRFGLRRARTGSDRTSTVPFGVSADGAVLTVDPTVSDMDSDVFGVNGPVRVADDGTRQGAIQVGERRVKRSPFAAEELHVEWIVPVGAPLLAVGTPEPQPDGTVQLQAGAGFALVSTKPETRIAARNNAAGTQHLPISANNVKHIIAGVLAVVVLVAAVVAAVALA